MPTTILPPLALGLAAGLNLYATVACLGLAGRFGWITPLPPELRGLEHPLVIAAALLFLVVEAFAERIPFVDSIWSAIHALLKPIAAGLLAHAILAGVPSAPAATLTAMAALLAFGAHVGRGVVLPSVERSHRPRAELALHLGLNVIAAALVITARDRPPIALIAGGLTLLWVVPRGPRSWRMFTLTLRAQVSRLRGIVGREKWQDESRLPADLRALLPTRDPPTPLRAARAGLKGLRTVGDYRQGWLIIGDEAPTFLYRSLLGPRVVFLPTTADARLVQGPWLDAVELSSEGGCCTVLLLKNGPRPELALADLAPAHTRVTTDQPIGFR